MYIYPIFVFFYGIFECFKYLYTHTHKKKVGKTIRPHLAYLWRQITAELYVLGQHFSL